MVHPLIAATIATATVSITAVIGVLLPFIVCKPSDNEDDYELVISG